VRRATARSREDTIPTRAWLVLVLAAGANVLPAMNLSIMNVVYPDVQTAFPDVSAAQLSWVLNAYTVVSAATLVIGGVTADRLGRKRCLLLGCTGFGVGSLICGFAPNVGTIIAGRIFIGISSSFVVTSNVALALREFPATRRSSAFGVIASFGGFAAAAGPTVGSLVLRAGGWRWAFWINVPVALVIVVLGSRIFAESRDPEARAFPDIVGAALLLAGISLGITAVVQSPTWGWLDARTAGCLIVGGLSLLWMLLRSARHASPMVDLTLFRSRNRSLFNVMAFLVSVGWFGMFFAMVQFLRGPWDYGIVRAGLFVTPIPFGAGVLGVLGGWVADRIGYRSMLIVGAMAFVVGSTWMALMVDSEPDVVAWMLGMVPIAIGTGLVFPSFQAGAVIDTPSEQYAVAVGVNQTIQRIGAAAGGAVAIAFIASVGPADALDRIFVVMLAAALVCIVTARALTPTPRRV
jgi:EmrB/QacA subfamily drug resistance transporter